jgi:hypothetical protein
MALALVATLALVASSRPAAAEWNILSTWLDPENPVPGQDTLAYVELATTENVTWIRVIQCTLEPYVCFTPLYVQSPDSTVTSVILREVDPGTPAGWNITVRYENGTVEQSPVFGNVYPGLETVSPVPEALYFKYVMGGGPTVKDDKGKPLPGYEAAVAVAVVLVVAVVIRRKRRPEE